MTTAPVVGAPVPVLVVDDTAMLRTLIVNKLNATGRYDVVAEAGNGREALDAAARHSPGLVMLDLQMPVMDGVTALPLLREQLGPDVPIVIFTGHDDHALLPGLVAAGATTSIGKGTPLRDVIYLLDELF